MERITLYYRSGASDKVYQAAIEPTEGGFTVQYAYGRRGTTLQTGRKTNTPVTHDEAKRIFDQLVAEKTAKGYSPGEDGTPYQMTTKADVDSGLRCQLLNAVEESEVDKLIADPAWWMQEKFDGRRMLVRKTGQEIVGINRLGLMVPLPATLVEALSHCPVDLILDGEAIGDSLHVFDAQQIGDLPLGKLRYAERYLQLLAFFETFPQSAIRPVPTYFNTGQKRTAFESLKQKGAEGVVFKHTGAEYSAGRPASGGPALKYKFCETASFITGQINLRRSVGLFLLEGDGLVAAGNVTIPPNHELPQAGQIVECRYLYAFRESGAIYQPVYRGVRDDLRREDCVIGQLKYKSEPVEEVA